MTTSFSGLLSLSPGPFQCPLHWCIRLCVSSSSPSVCLSRCSAGSCLSYVVDSPIGCPSFSQASFPVPSPTFLFTPHSHYPQTGLLLLHLSMPHFLILSFCWHWPLNQANSPNSLFLGPHAQSYDHWETSLNAIFFITSSQISNHPHARVILGPWIVLSVVLLL